MDGGVGGAEISVARLAEAVANSHDVEIIHHRTILTRERLSAYSGADLTGVRVRYVEPEPYSFGTSHIPWRRYAEARRWRASLSAPYDLFVSFVHGVPAFCHAPRGVLAVLFPSEVAIWRDESAATSLRTSFTRQAKRAYHHWEWKQRLERYQQKVAISYFSKEWAKRRWDIECDVIYPPVDTNFAVEEKENLILSVGRFAITGHSKKQLEMLTAFKASTDVLRTWEYFCVGGIEDSASGRAYLATVSSTAQQVRAHVEVDVNRNRLKRLYQRSKIFWHAAGLGEDEERYPERSEHFGIATVEAMAAGCVPIVINRGGQREIVEHGVNGFLWDTLEELQRYTTWVARDEQLRSRMADAARLRAQLFSTENFVSQFVRLCG
jgi:glycosyltransferase involved in cell wall biosynthesis